MKINSLTIGEVGQGLVDKDFSAKELTQNFIDQIKNKDESIHSYLATNFDIALSAAARVDTLIDNGEKLGKLAGVPAAIKDVIVTKDLTTTASSKILENFIPPYNATVVSKLEEEHAIILGKNNSDEFAMGSSNENSAYEKTVNPVDPTRVPGGSSGGSAAAVAADMAVFSLASDTGGSIRQPAALCGVVGLKPTYGRVSRFGLIAMASSLDQIGPITHNVEDAAIVLESIAGDDIYDDTTVANKPADFTTDLKKDIKGTKVGIVKEYFGEGLDEGSKKAVEDTIKKLEELGCDIEEVNLPHSEYALAVYYIVMPAEVSTNLARFDGIRFGKSRDFFGDEVKKRIILGTFVLSSGYQDKFFAKANLARQLIRDDFDMAFEKVDVLVGPTSPTVAWKIGEKVDDPLKMYLSDIYTVSVNLAGNPAISIPCGIDQDMPVGFQIIGKHFEEAKLLQVAHNLEGALKA